MTKEPRPRIGLALSKRNHLPGEQDEIFARITAFTSSLVGNGAIITAIRREGLGEELAEHIDAASIQLGQAVNILKRAKGAPQQLAEMDHQAATTARQTLQRDLAKVSALLETARKGVNAIEVALCTNADTRPRSLGYSGNVHVDDSNPNITRFSGTSEAAHDIQETFTALEIFRNLRPDLQNFDQLHSITVQNQTALQGTSPGQPG